MDVVRAFACSNRGVWVTHLNLSAATRFTVKVIVITPEQRDQKTQQAAGRLFDSLKSTCRSTGTDKMILPSSAISQIATLPFYLRRLLFGCIWLTLTRTNIMA